MKKMIEKIRDYIAGFFDKEVVTTEGDLLSLDLQFFSDPGNDPDNNSQEPSATDPSKQDPKQEPSADPKSKVDHMIPKYRFDEINENYKAVKSELDELKQAQEQAKLDRQKKQGEFEKLYNQTSEELETYKPYKTRVEQLEGVITSMLETKLESIPEEFHDLIPENLSPEQKLDWISKADAKGLFKDASQEPVGSQTNPTQQKTDLENMNPMQLLAAGYGSKK